MPLKSFQDIVAYARHPRAPRAAACALLAFHLLFNIVWLNLDNHAVRTDEEGHMLMARNYYEAWTKPDNKNIIERFVEIGRIPLQNPAHPPFLHILGALSIGLFGYSTDVIAFVNTLSFLALLAGILVVARRFLPPWHALYCAFVVSFTPVIYCASRLFMTDFLAGAIVVWMLYALLRCHNFERTGWVFLFALLNGCALLTRTITPLYYLIPSGVLFFWGLARSLPVGERKGLGWNRTGKIALHGVLTIVVTVGVAAPWYFHNLDGFYRYWTEENGKGYGVVNLSSLPEDPACDTPETVPAARDDNFRLAEVSLPPAGARTFFHTLFSPPVSWAAYPFFLINHLLFLPLTLLALVGLLILPFRPHGKTLEALLLVLWILGSWVMLTLVLKICNPRYFIPAVPACGVLAALAITSLPWTKIRRGAMGVLAVYLLFAFGNLSVHAYGRLARAEIPCPGLPPVATSLGSEGLVLWNTPLAVSNAYSYLAAPTRDNFRERLMDAMVEFEVDHAGLFPGEFANYIKLNVRGMELYERHYWPLPNPFLGKGLNPDALPRRKLHGLILVHSPDECGALLPAADYVIYEVDFQDVQKEVEWTRYFQERGFDAILRFEQDGFGKVPPRTYGVLAKTLESRKQAISSVESIDALSLNDLQTVVHSPGFKRLSAPLQEHARQRLDESIARISSPTPMVPGITFMSLGYAPGENGWYTFQFIFRVDADIMESYKIFFWGMVTPEYVSRLPEKFQADGVHYWNFAPEPATNSWKAGDYVFVSHPIRPETIPYANLRLGFMRDKLPLGNVIDLGPYDFSKAAHAAPASKE